ncbi:MAG: hypothetical protein AVDCRST_MAG52-1508, partial [uncultured Blastococcus sp.]
DARPADDRLARPGGRPSRPDHPVPPLGRPVRGRGRRGRRAGVRLHDRSLRARPSGAGHLRARPPGRTRHPRSGRRHGGRRARPARGRAADLVRPGRADRRGGAAEPGRGGAGGQPLLRAAGRVLRARVPAHLGPRRRHVPVGRRLPVRPGVPATSGHVAGV